MANKFQNKAKLTNKIIHNDKYTELEFSLAEKFPMEFKSGQYVSIQVAQPKVLRSYSICSDQSIQDKFKLMIDVTPQGIGTKFLQSLNIGDEIDIMGPLGRFMLRDTALEKSVVLIGTGSGVAPLVSMLKDLLLNKKTTKPVLLLWGERFADKLIWQKELFKLSETYKNFRIVDVISRPRVGENNYHGRVTDYVQNETLPEDAEYYLCGRKEMINDVTELLREKGIEEESICHEKFD